MSKAKDFIAEKYPGRVEVKADAPRLDAPRLDAPRLDAPQSNTPRPDLSQSEPGPQEESRWRKFCYFILGMSVFYMAFTAISAAAKQFVEFLRATF